MENQEVLHILCVCVCSLSYPACKTHVLYYNVICGLAGLSFFDRFSRKAQILNFIKTRPVGHKLFHADGRTDTTKLIVAFRNLAKAPETLIKNKLKFTTVILKTKEYLFKSLPRSPPQLFQISVTVIATVHTGSKLYVQVSSTRPALGKRKQTWQFQDSGFQFYSRSNHQMWY